MYNLSPYDFDQTDKGWSSLDKRGKYLEAAELIEAYITQNREQIKAQDKTSIQTMYFHAGQEYAMAGSVHNDKAIENFKKSYKNKLDWDIYVDGTIAFLERDEENLRVSSDKLTELAENNNMLAKNARLLEDYLVGLKDNVSYAVIYDNQSSPKTLTN